MAFESYPGSVVSGIAIDSQTHVTSRRSEQVSFSKRLKGVQVALKKQQPRHFQRIFRAFHRPSSRTEDRFRPMFLTLASCFLLFRASSDWAFAFPVASRFFLPSEKDSRTFRGQFRALKGLLFLQHLLLSRLGSFSGLSFVPFRFPILNALSGGGRHPFSRANPFQER